MASQDENLMMIDWYKFFTYTEVERHLILSLVSFVEIKLLSTPNFEFSEVHGCFPSWLIDCVNWQKFTSLSHLEREQIGLNLTVLKGRLITHETSAYELCKILKALKNVQGPVPDWYDGPLMEWTDEAQHFNFQRLLVLTSSQLYTVFRTLEMVDHLVETMPADTSARDDVLENIRCCEVDLFEFARCSKHNRQIVCDLMQKLWAICEKVEYWHITRIVESKANPNFDRSTPVAKPKPNIVPDAPKKRKQNGVETISLDLASSKRRLFFGSALVCPEHCPCFSDEDE